MSGKPFPESDTTTRYGFILALLFEFVNLLLPLLYSVYAGGMLRPFAGIGRARPSPEPGNVGFCNLMMQL